MGNDLAVPAKYRNTELRNAVISEVKELGKAERAFLGACRSGDVVKIRSLLESNVDPAIPGLTLCSPLHYIACSSGSPNHVNIANILLRNGVSTMVQAKDGASPLHTVVVVQSNDIVALQLIEAMVFNVISSKQLVMPDKGGNTPIHLAAALGRVHVLLALLRKAEEFDCIQCIARVNYQMETPLHQTQSATCARVLLAYKGDFVNALDMNGRTSLHLAVAKKNLALTKVLLEQGASPDIQDNGHFSAISLIQDLLHPTEIDYLILNHLEMYKARKEETESNTVSPFQYFNPPTVPSTENEIKQLKRDLISLQGSYEKVIQLMQIEFSDKIATLEEKVVQLSSFHVVTERSGMNGFSE